MITIATYRSLISAELAKTRLASGNVRAVIADACSYALGYGSLIDGVRLQVAATDAERAKEILEATELAPDAASMAESPAAEADSVGAPRESAGCAPASRTGGWAGALLFLLGIACLVLGRPAGVLHSLPVIAGQLILLGEILIVAGLWISYGHLRTTEDDL